MSSANRRLPFVAEEDRDEYMKDYVAECKKTKRVKIVKTDNTKKNIIHTYYDLITGVMSKPIAKC